MPCCTPCSSTDVSPEPVVPVAPSVERRSPSAAGGELAYLRPASGRPVRYPSARLYRPPEQLVVHPDCVSDPVEAHYRIDVEHVDALVDHHVEFEQRRSKRPATASRSRSNLAVVAVSRSYFPPGFRPPRPAVSPAASEGSSGPCERNRVPSRPGRGGPALGRGVAGRPRFGLGGRPGACTHWRSGSQQRRRSAWRLAGPCASVVSQTL